MQPLRRGPKVRIVLLLLTLGALLGGCSASAKPSSPAIKASLQSVEVQAMPLQPRGSCTNRFVAHDLSHTTRAPGDATRLFDSNGAGLAINDLDNDGDLDIVLANLSAPATLLWNAGDLTFRRGELPLMRRARAVAAIDVDGDGWTDLTFTNGVGGVAYFRNDGAGGFDLTPLPGVTQPAYAMHWADWDADGDLDLVTGSYDAGLMVEQANTLLLGGGGGVTYYERDGDGFVAHSLADEAQALAVTAMDLNDDSRLDILIGNDFDLPDYAYLQQEDGDWLPAEPFQTYTHSTMGFDQVDTDNDGRWELFATDMKPYTRAPAVLAAWVPLMQDGYETRREDDPQISENVLQKPAGGAFRNRAYDQGIDATGWSWSGKFGDLDNDGWQDLYVVNGMIAADLLDHLAGGELVEENQAFRNEGRGRFSPAPDWRLDSTRSGRSMSMADLDDDGDLDIVVNNLNSPAQLFENQLCGGDGLMVDLRWTGAANPAGLGAELALHTAEDSVFRAVRAGSGYLSGDPGRVHFGVGEAPGPLLLTVRWPDGLVSHISPVAPNTRLTVTRAQALMADGGNRAP